MDGAMFSEVTLTHEQQQEAAERVLKLMQEERLSSGQAIKIVADELRARAQAEKEQKDS